MNQDLRCKLDRIADALRSDGAAGPVAHIEQISYLIYLKLLDEEEAAREQPAPLEGRDDNGAFLFPQQASRFRWRKWRDKSGPELRDFLRDDVFPYMASLVKEDQQVAECFRDAVLEIVDPDILKQVVDEIDEIEFRELGPDVGGDIFECLLTRLGQPSRDGMFRTPRQIRAFMVAMTDPGLGDAIYDPACGTGGFLTDCVDHLLAEYSGQPHEVPIYGEEWLDRHGFASLDEAKRRIPSLQTYRNGVGEKIPDWELMERSIHGLDISRQMTRISLMNLALHGVRRADLKRGDALSGSGGLTGDDLEGRYQVVLSTPPFAGVLQKEFIRPDLPTRSKRGDLLFLGVVMRALAPGGRCAVVVPEGVLSGSTEAHTDLRRTLVETFDLLAVVSLPVGAFRPHAAAGAAVLVFRRPPEGPEPAVERVWFYEIANDGYASDKTVGEGRAETPERNCIPDLLAQWSVYRRSGFREPPGPEAGTLLDPGADAPRCWWADVEVVGANGYSLAAGRYRPQVADVAPEEDPAQLVREVLHLEREITSGLENLLSEMEGR